MQLPTVPVFVNISNAKLGTGTQVKTVLRSYYARCPCHSCDLSSDPLLDLLIRVRALSRKTGKM